MSNGKKKRKKKNNKKIKREAKFLYLLVLLFFTAIMLTTTTYAWFTSNRIVTINTINIHVATAGGVEVSADGANWKAIITPEDITTVHNTTYPRSVNQLPDKMEPVSTGKEIDYSTGFMKMYYGLADNNDDGYYILTSTRTIETESSGDSSDGKFVVFDLFFRVSNDTQIYMTNESKVSYVNETGKGIAAATRIAFVDEGTVPTGSTTAEIQALHGGTSGSTYIWEPNYDVHTLAAVANARDVYGITTTETNASRITYDGVINEIPSSAGILLKDAKNSKYPNYFKPVNIDYYTRQSFSEFQPVFILRGGITKMRIYMWIEGQDVDCENNASFDDIQFDLQLTINPA